MTWRRAAAWRAHRHLLDRRARAGSMLAVTSRLCGLHAQVMSSAELTAWARVEGLGRGEVQRALWEDRTLLKTWAMRGTLHLLPANELPLWRAALTTSRRYLREKAWQNYFGITLTELDRLTIAIGEALQDRLLTREELVAEITRLTGTKAFTTQEAANSWGTIFKPAAFSGRLCFAPSVGQRVRFTHPDTWLAAEGRSDMEAEAATAAITRRFLGAHGPATHRDLSRWWNGGGTVMGRRWIAALGDEAVPVEIEGEPAWMLAKDVRKLRDLPPVRSVRLLPGFDQYVIASSCHAEHLMPGALRNRVFRPQGWISPVLLVNGMMHGVWRHELKGSRVEVTIEPFVDTPQWARRAAGEEAERLAEFLGGSLKLEWKRCGA